MRGAPDEEHLKRAHNERRVIFTQDDDFLRLHAAGMDHAGIVEQTASADRGSRCSLRPLSAVVGQPGLIWTIMETDTVTRVLGILSAIVFRFAVVRNFYKDIAKKVGYTSSCYIVNWGTKCQRIEEQA
jgi:hypothetical protein